MDGVTGKPGALQTETRKKYKKSHLQLSLLSLTHTEDDRLVRRGHKTFYRLLTPMCTAVVVLAAKALTALYFLAVEAGLISQ